MSVEEREETFVNLARHLDTTAMESMVEGYGRFAMFTKNMADAIRVNADELARDDVRHAEQVMRHAVDLIRKYSAAYPHRMLSRAVH